MTTEMGRARNFPLRYNHEYDLEGYSKAKLKIKNEKITSKNLFKVFVLDISSNRSILCHEKSLRKVTLKTHLWPKFRSY